MKPTARFLAGNKPWASFVSGWVLQLTMHEAPKGTSVSHGSTAGVENSGPASAARPWVCVPYVADEADVLGPSAVEHCPWWDGQAACRLSKHSWRDRKKPRGCPAGR